MNNQKLFKYFFGCPPETFPGTVIITPFISTDSFIEHCEPGTPFKGVLYSGRTASAGGRGFAVVRCGMGSAAAGDAVLLLGMTPVKEILFAGACGGLRNCRIGDMILCESAFDGEGFTRYHREKFDMKTVFDSGGFVPGDAGYVEKLRNFMCERLRDKTSLKIGDIFTIGSLTAESDGTLTGIEEKGFCGIDLELSAVYHAAGVTGRKAAALTAVSDLPLTKPLWEKRTQEEKDRYSGAMKDLTRLAVEFVSA